MTITDYIMGFPLDKQIILQKVYTIIKKRMPDALEKISYGMPCFWDDENLIFFAAMKNHLGIYPTADGVANFSDKLVGYKTSKGAIQFPWDKDIPYDLIDEMARYRAETAKQRKSK